MLQMQVYKGGEALKVKISLWRIKESRNFLLLCGQILGNIICSNILNDCEWGKIEMTRMFPQEREKNMTVTETNCRLRCQQSTRAEAALKWGFF